MNLAVIKDGKVINTVLVSDTWAGIEGEWKIPDGCDAVPSNDASIGDKWDGVQITNNRGPKPGQPNPEREALREKAEVIAGTPNIPVEIKDFVKALIKRIN